MTFASVYFIAELSTVHTHKVRMKILIKNHVIWEVHGVKINTFRKGTNESTANIKRAQCSS